MAETIDVTTELGVFTCTVTNAKLSKVKCAVLDIFTRCHSLGKSALSAKFISPTGIAIASLEGCDLTTADGLARAIKLRANPGGERRKAFCFPVRLLTGHPDVTIPLSNAIVHINGGNADILTVDSDGSLKQRAIIDLSTVEDVMHEDASTIEKRITATRLLTVGVFAFAAKKTEKTELHYVTVKWRDGKFVQETIFEFFGPESQKHSAVLRNMLMAAANAVPTRKPETGPSALAEPDSIASETTPSERPRPKDALTAAETQPKQAPKGCTYTIYVIFALIFIWLLSVIL